MSSLAQILPFLAALQKQQGISTGPDAGAPDDNTTNLNSTLGRGSVINPQQWQFPPDGQQGPPAPVTPPQQSADVSPNLSVGNQQQPDLSDIAGDVPSGKQAQPKLAKGTQLLMLLKSGLQGGIAGMEQNAQTYAATGRNAGFGGGLYGAVMQPIQQQRGYLENQQLIQMLPFLRAQNIAGIQEKTSQAQKNYAEAGNFAIKNQLEAAQAQAAFYKDDPNLGLIDIRTGQPVAGGAGMAPLTAQEAAILGKQPGDQVPLKIKNQANEMVNRGIKSVSAGGRQLLVDNQGNTIKDMGQATPLTVINAQMGAFANPQSPEVQAMVDSVGQGKMDLPTALSSMRRNPAAAAQFMGALLSKYPDYNQANFGVSAKTLQYFTTGEGAKQLTGFRTAIDHADLLDQAAQALHNGDSRTLSSLKNTFQTQFGSPDVTTFDAIANAYNHEVSSVISKGHITDKEVATGGATMPSNANYETIHSVMQAYKQLMSAKAHELMQQYDQGRQAQPAFPQTQSGPPAGATMKVPGSDGQMHWSDGKNDLGVAQ